MQENLENTLASLVAIPSVSDDSSACQAIINFIHEELKVYELFIQTNSDTQNNPWLIATTRNTHTPDILFYAHLDIVTGTPNLFQMRKADGRLLGRGVFDMKFAAACYLEFLRNFTGTLSDLNIGFLFTTDEEDGSGCMREVIASDLRPKVILMSDGGDNWSIEKRAKGFCAADLTTTGKAAHGSRPWEGLSALHSLLDILQPLREKYSQYEKDHPTLMVNGIQSGSAINQIPDHAVAQIDFRCFEKHEMNDFLTLLDDMVKAHDNLTLNIRCWSHAIEFDETSPYVQEFLHSLREVRDVTPTFTDSYGGADSRFFTPFGIPCIIIEPRGGGRHSNDEWLMADDLIVYYQLIERWIMQTTKRGSSQQRHPERVLIQ